MLKSELIQHGIYESERDNDRAPACWRCFNNGCSPHFHSSLEFVYILDGEMKALLNGRPLDVHEHEVLIVPSLTVHYFFTEAHSEAVVLIVPLDYIPTFRKQFETHTFANLIYRDPEPASELRNSMERLSGHSLPGGSPILRGYTYLIVGLLTELVGLRELANDHSSSLVRSILTYLQANYRSPLSLGELAQTFGYSKSRFSHLFQSSIGYSPMEYIASLRCRNALTMMHDGSPMIEAAFGSGFESMRTFYRAFRRCFDETPTRYFKGLPAAASAAGAYERAPAGPSMPAEWRGRC